MTEDCPEGQDDDRGAAMGTTRGKIPALQGLRVLAFVGIFLSHAIDTPSGAWGVSIFIMLSGFVMTYSYWDRAAAPENPTWKSALRFSMKKIRPLYPLHLIMLAVALIPYYLIPAILSHSRREMLKVAAKLVITIPLIQTWFPVGYEAINTVAWYLSATLFFYAVFPWILRFLKRDFGRGKMLGMILLTYSVQISFAFVTQYLPLLNKSHWSCYILPLFRLGDFFIGCCLGYCFLTRGSKRLNTACASAFEIICLLLGLAGMVCLARMDADWFMLTLVFVPSSAGIVYLLARSEGILSKVLSMKGFQAAAVFTPYAFLIHRQVLHYIEDGYMLLTGKEINAWLFIFVSMVLTLAFSKLYMLAAEKRKEGRRA